MPLDFVNMQSLRYPKESKNKDLHRDPLESIQYILGAS